MHLLWICMRTWAPLQFFYVKALATPAVHPAPSFLFSVELEAECAFDNNKIEFLFSQFIPFPSLVASRDDHGEVFHVFYNDVIGLSAWISCPPPPPPKKRGGGGVGGVYACSELKFSKLYDSQNFWGGELHQRCKFFGRESVKLVYPISFSCGVTWRPWRSVSCLLQWCNRTFCVDFLLKKKRRGGRVYACSELKFSKLWFAKHFGGRVASRVQILWQGKC